MNDFTPGPWDAVAATEHHGWYVTSDYGNTICDLYCMSRPDLPSTINGGESRPIPFMHEMAGPNARLIAAAPDLLAALTRMLESVGDVSMDGYVENSLHSSDVEEARAAIAKAGGAS